MLGARVGECPIDQRRTALDREAAAAVRRHYLIAELDRAAGGWRATERGRTNNQALGLVDEQPQPPAAGIGRRGGAQRRVGGVVEALGEGRQLGRQIGVGKIAVQQPGGQFAGVLAVADQRPGERTVDRLQGQAPGVKRCGESRRCQCSVTQ